MFGFYQSYACHNSEINSVTSVDNGDGTTTFTINVTVDVGSSDGYNYGFLLDFYSSNNPVVVQSISPASFSKSGEDIVGYYGNNVGSGDYTNSGVNGFGIYAAENVVAYEYVGRYWYTSSDYTSEVVVTVSGCVEEIMFQADFRSATLDPYSLADQCADFYTVGVCQNDPCPANNTSIESCSGFFDLNISSQLIKKTTSKNSAGEDLSYSIKVLVNVDIIENNENINKASFEKNISYNTLNSKFELRQYEKVLTNDLVEQIILDINMFLGSVK